MFTLQAYSAKIVNPQYLKVMAESDRNVRETAEQAIAAPAPKKYIQDRTPSDDSFSTLGTKETKTVIIEFSNSGKEKEKNESLEAKKKRLEAEYFRTTEEYSQLNNLYKLKRKEYLESNNEEDDNSADELEFKYKTKYFVNNT